MADARHAENRFWPHSAADCAISVKFCVRSVFPQNLGKWDR